MNRNRNGQNRQTQDHTDGKTYENTTSDNETCALWIKKVFTFKKKINQRWYKSVYLQFLFCKRI